MKRLLIIALTLVSLTACKKEETQKATATCSCYEYHEHYVTYMTPQGTVSMQWEHNYDSDAIYADCSTASGWVYYGGTDTQRYKVICQ